MKFAAYYDRLNDRKVLACIDCYDKKDTLKAIGFSWNPLKKEWFKTYGTLHEMTSLFVEALIACDCEYEVYENSWSESSKSDMNKIFDEDSYTPEFLEKFVEKYGE